MLSNHPGPIAVCRRGRPPAGASAQNRARPGSGVARSIVGDAVRNLAGVEARGPGSPIMRPGQPKPDGQPASPPYPRYNAPRQSRRPRSRSRVRNRVRAASARRDWPAGVQRCGRPLSRQRPRARLTAAATPVAQMRPTNRSRSDPSATRRQRRQAPTARRKCSLTLVQGRKQVGQNHEPIEITKHGRHEIAPDGIHIRIEARLHEARERAASCQRKKLRPRRGGARRRHQEAPGCRKANPASSRIRRRNSV